MRARMGFLGVLVFLAGCGGSDVPGLVGEWAYASADGSSGQGVRFNADGTYQFDMLVLTSQSTANDERASGSWTATATTVTVAPAQSTCSDLSPATLGWVRVGADLKISSSAGEVVYVPLPPSASAAALAFGCYVNGTWVPAQ